MIYRQFIRFMFPLLVTAVVFEFGIQFLNGGMARMPPTLAMLTIDPGAFRSIKCRASERLSSKAPVRLIWNVFS